MPETTSISPASVRSSGFAARSNPSAANSTSRTSSATSSRSTSAEEQHSFKSRQGHLQLPAGRHVPGRPAAGNPILPANGSPRPWRRHRRCAAPGACPVIEEMITPAPPPAVRRRVGPIWTSSEAWPAFRAKVAVDRRHRNWQGFRRRPCRPRWPPGDHQGRRALPRSRLPRSSVRRCS
jgi:hypothetical protein